MIASRRLLFTILSLLALASGALAQNTAPILQEPQTIPLWEGRAPGALGDAPEDVPTLTIYMPPNTAGPMTAVIVAPGGGYRALSMNKEGRIPGNYLNSLGIAAFVLKYRLGPKYHHPVELGDMQRAIRTLRSRASEWHLAPDRIGVMGFSAGGHLASTASTQFDRGNAASADAIDRASSRPDFAILGYPVDHAVGAMDPSRIQNHAARRECRDRAGPSSVDRYSGHRGHAADILCFTRTRIRLCLWRTACTTSSPCGRRSVPAEMHIFKDGAHGAGMPMNDTALSEWPKVLANWMRASGFL